MCFTKRRLTCVLGHTLPHPHPSTQTAAKVLEGAHQQHGFLSITYTQAITKNVRHKLTTRPERPSRSGAAAASQRLGADPLADSSPQYLREILLTAQPFDVVVSCPLLATVAGIFQVDLKKCKFQTSRWFQEGFVRVLCKYGKCHGLHP